ETEGADELLGAGVYYGAALTEAASYRGQDVIVVGGANSAGQGAMFFSRHARSVTIVVRGPDLSAGVSRSLLDRMKETENIKLLPNTMVMAAHGNGRLEAVTVMDTATGERRDLAAAGMFIFIGTAPRTDLCADVVMRDAQGFVLTGRDVMVDG